MWLLLLNPLRISDLLEEAQPQHREPLRCACFTYAHFVSKGCFILLMSAYNTNFSIFSAESCCVTPKTLFLLILKKDKKQGEGKSHPYGRLTCMPIKGCSCRKWARLQLCKHVWSLTVRKWGKIRKGRARSWQTLKTSPSSINQVA